MCMYICLGVYKTCLRICIDAYLCMYMCVRMHTLSVYAPKVCASTHVYMYAYIYT